MSISPFFIKYSEGTPKRLGAVAPRERATRVGGNRGAIAAVKKRTGCGEDG